MKILNIISIFTLILLSQSGMIAQSTNDTITGKYKTDTLQYFTYDRITYQGTCFAEYYKLALDESLIRYSLYDKDMKAVICVDSTFERSQLNEIIVTWLINDSIASITKKYPDGKLKNEYKTCMSKKHGTIGKFGIEIEYYKNGGLKSICKWDTLSYLPNTITIVDSHKLSDIQLDSVGNVIYIKEEKNGISSKTTIEYYANFEISRKEITGTDGTLKIYELYPNGLPKRTYISENKRSIYVIYDEYGRVRQKKITRLRSLAKDD